MFEYHICNMLAKMDYITGYCYSENGYLIHLIECKIQEESGKVLCETLIGSVIVYAILDNLVFIFL